jgi:centrin-1
VRATLLGAAASPLFLPPPPLTRRRWNPPSLLLSFPYPSTSFCCFILARSRAILATLSQQLDEEDLEEVQEAFNLFDRNGTGTIDLRELKAAFRALGFKIKSPDLKQMVHTELDSSDISFGAFVRLVTPMILQRDERDEIMKVFELFDTDGTNTINFENLRRVADELGEELTPADLKEMLEEADRDGDNEIDRDDFFRVMRKPSSDPLDDLSSDEEDDGDDDEM